MPRLKTIIAINFLFLIFQGVLLSQEVLHDKFTRFVNYTTHDGLSNNEINDIIQDNQGFMWFATENGLSRFDGYSFVNFFHDNQNENTISGNIVTSLTLDDRSNLWIGTTEGLCKLNIYNGSIHRHYAKTGEINTPRTNHIRKVHFSDRTKTLWVETVEGTLSSLDLSTESWSHYNHTAVSQPFYRYHTLFEDSDGNIWVGGRNTPVMKFDIVNKTFTHFLAKGEAEGSKRDNDTANIFETSDGKWYVVGLDGVYNFYPDTERFDKIYSTSTYSIIQDEEGYVWFASGNGLLKLCNDTHNFTIFRYNQNNPNSLVNNHVKKVYVDSQGNVWAGTRRGVSLLSQKSKLFQQYYNIPGDRKSISSNEVSAIAQGDDGKIYIGTASNGLNFWKQNHNTFQHITANLNSPCSLSSNNISALYFDRNGELWVGLWSGIGFNRYNPKNKCFTRYAMDYTSRKSDWYNVFLEDTEGNFILGMWGASGAIYFDRNKGQYTEKTFVDYAKPYESSVKMIASNGLGLFFFLSQYKGTIYTYDSKSNTYSSKTGVQSFSKSSFHRPYDGREYVLPLSFDNASCFATDGLGLSFIATDAGIVGHTTEEGYFLFYEGVLNPISVGFFKKNLYVLEPNRLLVFNKEGSISRSVLLNDFDCQKILFFDDYLMILGNNYAYFAKECDIIKSDSWAEIELFQNNYLKDAAITNGSLWIGSQQGLFRFDLKNLNDNGDNYRQEPIISIPVSSILLQIQNLLVFSPMGLFNVDLSTNHISSIDVEQVPKDFKYAVSSAYPMNTDTVWLGNADGHFQLILSQKKIIQTNLPDNNRATSRLISTLMQDRNEDIWIGTTDKGLNRRDSKTGFFQHFYQADDDASIPSNSINAITQSIDGKVWVATDKGLCYIVKDHVFRVTNPLALNDIRSLVEDPNGLLWAGTSNGLISVDPSTADIKIYDESDGLPTADFSKASLLLNNGYLAFGSSNGLILLNPDNLGYNFDYSNDVTFTQFSIFGNPYRYTFQQHDTINLHYSQNFFEINFTATDYGQKPGTTFKYRLVGVDPSWVDSKLNTVSYTNVPPGHYLFEVTKLLPNGQVADNTASLFIRIKPAFWQTIWFRFLIAFTITGGVLAYAFTYIKRLKSDRLNVELEQRLLVSQMNPHFIFNSLSAIQSFMYSNQPEEAGNYLSSFSRLVRLILDNSRSSLISIKQEIQTLELYLSLQKLRFPDKFIYSIEIDDELKHSDIQLPPMLAQPFIENSIEHGILHKQGIGKILISFKVSGKLMTIIVEDDGIGIEKSRAMKKNVRLSHSSLATSIARERIKNISKRKDKNIGVKIFDLSPERNEGTRVLISFPLVKK